MRMYRRDDHYGPAYEYRREVLVGTAHCNGLRMQLLEQQRHHRGTGNLDIYEEEK